MSELSQSIINLLPNQVTVKNIVNPNVLSGSGPGVGEDSYFDFQITDETGILSGSVDGFCIDTDRNMPFAGFDFDNDGVYGESGVLAPSYTEEYFPNLDPQTTTFTEPAPQDFQATVYSSYDPAVLSDGLGGQIEKPENLDSVNWLVNNLDTPALSGYNTATIQMAIWALMDDGQYGQNSNTIRNLRALAGDYTQADVNAVVALAEQQGEGFEPGVGDKLVVILVPDGNNNNGIDGNPDAQIIITTVELAKLGDRVWHDLDADGVQDAGEASIAGATVNLLADIDGNGTIEDTEIVDSTTTDSNGEYNFTVVAGDYKVQFETPDGFEMSSPANPANNPLDPADTLDSDAGVNGVTGVISLEPGEYDPTIDAGFFKKAGLGDFVFEDSNANGIQDAGEAGIDGVEVKLLADLDNDGQIDDVVATTVTGDDPNTAGTQQGYYEFTGLNPGDYKVMFTQPDGFDGVSPFQAGGDPTADSDADPDNGLMSDVVNLESGEFDPTIDAGFFKTAGLGDFVFEDKNADGIQDAGEAGIDGVEVKLLADTDGDGQIDDVVATTTTGDDPNTLGTQQGYYEFTGLTPGVEYKVMFTQPTGFTEVSPFQSGGPTVDSDADPNNGLMSDVVVLESGEFDPTIDAGFYNLAGLGDFVFEDSNANGIQDAGEAGIDGVTVKLLADNDGDGNFTDLVATTTTGDDPNTAGTQQGYYEFTGLNPGDYKVMFTQPDGFDGVSPFQAGGDPTVDSDADPDNGLMSDVVNLESGEFDPTIDAGFFKTAGLGDFVFEDKNADGIQDAGEAGIDGVEVKLLADTDGDGQIDDVVATTTTGDDPNTLGTQQGYYEFTGLTPGVEYKVMFTQPTGFTEVSPFQEGVDPTVDSDADPNNGLMSDVVVLESGEFDPTIDAGFYNLAGLGDFVFEDSNANGIQDAGEAGIDGVTVKLLADNDGDGNFTDLIATTTTGDDPNTAGTQQGYYEFTRLNPGDYKVMFTQPDGFDGVSPFQAGGDPNVDSDADPDNGLMSDVVNLESGEFDPTIDAGFFKTPQNPGIDIEKHTNGVDADTLDQAAKVVAGETVTWRYKVTNTGDVDFDESEVVVTDDQEGTITNIINKGDGDNVLAAGETWIYEATGIAQDFSGSTGDTQTLYLTGNSYLDGSNGNVRTFTAGGVSVDASAFSRTKGSSGTWESAFLGAFSSGLGVTDRSEGNGGNGTHRVDNIDRDNFVLFEFSEQVVVDRALLASVVGDSDITYWVGNADGPFTMGDSFLGSLDLQDDNYTSSSRSRWANINNGEVAGNVLVIAAATSDHTPEDRFKIKKLQFQTVGDDGFYKNTGTVVAGDVSDEDHSHYVNEDPDPGIDIEKFLHVDGQTIDVDFNNLPEIEAGTDLSFIYEVKNTGNVSFHKGDVTVKDDNGTPNYAGDDFTAIYKSGDVNNNNRLDIDETWIYKSGPLTAENLTVATDPEHYTFHLTGHSYTTGHLGNTRHFSAGDVNAEVSAFRSSKDQKYWDKAYLGAYGGGLGVTNKYEGGSGHRVDNGGSNDYILFEFDKNVVVDRAFLDYVGHDSDASIWIGNRNGDINSAADLKAFVADNTQEKSYGGSYSRWANFNDGEVSGNTLVIAADTHGHNDSFKLKKLDVSVPGVLTVEDYINTATVHAGGVSDSDQSGYTNPGPVDPLNEYHYEAEDMHLCYYKVEHNGAASGDELIRLTNHWGYASDTFEGETGKYDVIIHYFDENDGESTGTFKVGGSVEGTWAFDKELGSNLATPDTLTSVTFEDVHLTHGVGFSIHANQDEYEFGRIDKITFVEAAPVV